MTAYTVFMAGGGTGGHVFPLLSVARALQAVMPEIEPIFIGTDRGIEGRVVPAAGFRLELLATLPFRGGGLSGASKGLLSVAKMLPRARSLLHEYAPRAVFSVGGYAAVPIALGARLGRIPLALMEPNMTPGLANRLVGPVARRVYTAFEETSRSFPAAAVLRTGVALRPGFEPSPYEWDGKGQPLRVLVLGGSQGARSLNDVVAPALSRIKLPLSIVHQVGKGNLIALRQRYGELRRPGASVIEFIDDMAAAIRSADLVISRAGAGAIGEICAVGRPSILLPLPASGDHQLHNARGLERAGAAICVPAKEARVETLSERVSELARDPERLARMAGKASAWGRPDAADRVARDLLELAGLTESATDRAGHDTTDREAAVSRAAAEAGPLPAPGKDG
jgi:UDP-N-acetylglucosamine--N-acetylmuramyl-(pentapeptide) pyrophosphoryl-undecaprenol N-acetylglucosamine transferase